MLFMAANVSCLSVYTLHTHIEGQGELHFILQGWKVLTRDPSAWGGWGICSAMRNWEENCSLHLQGLLGEETFTWIHFSFHLHVIFTMFFARSLPACTFISLLQWRSLHFGNSAGVKCFQCYTTTFHVRHRGAGLTLPVIPVPAEAVPLLWTFPTPTRSVSSPTDWPLPIEKRRAVLPAKLGLCFAIFLSCLFSFLPSPPPALSPSLAVSWPLIPPAAKCHWHKIKVQWPCLDGGGQRQGKGQVGEDGEKCGK